MELRFSGATDTGRVRSENQDAIFVPPRPAPRGRPTFFILADGMGGASGGAVASRTAVEVVRRELERTSARPPWDRALAAAARRAAQAIADKASRDPALRGMGTTLVVLALEDAMALVASLGDSRCYLLRAGRLHQITADHSLVAEQVRDGSLTPDQARGHQLRNVLTKALGAIPDAAPDVFSIRVRGGDRFLLCSDGLHGVVGERDIAQALAAPQPEARQVAALVELAKRAGGPDNISAIVVRVADAAGEAGADGPDTPVGAAVTITKLPPPAAAPPRARWLWAAAGLAAALILAAAGYFLADGGP
ncbi:MAG: Stp1/IreP family PP2C-type Ser/Thr phosphatase [Thermodesulfobacteriota bacterium]